MMVSGVLLQCGHESEGDLVMRLRYLFKGQWFVRSQMSIDVCRRRVLRSVSFVNELDRSLGSIHDRCS